MLYLKKMGKKCIICESKNDGISFYKIQHQRGNDKQNRWISAVKEFDPAIVVKNDRLIYSLHWPVNIPTTPYYGRERPVDPSSISPKYTVISGVCFWRTKAKKMKHCSLKWMTLGGG